MQRNVNKVVKKQTGKKKKGYGAGLSSKKRFLF